MSPEAAPWGRGNEPGVAIARGPDGTFRKLPPPPKCTVDGCTGFECTYAPYIDQERVPGLCLRHALEVGRPAEQERSHRVAQAFYAKRDAAGPDDHCCTWCNEFHPLPQCWSRPPDRRNTDRIAHWNG